MEKIVEERIQEALKNGEFDNLPGKGKPLDLSDYFKTPPHLRMAHNLLKNANVLPPEVDLKREIEALKEERAAAIDPQRRLHLFRIICLKEIQLNMMLESRAAGR